MDAVEYLKAKARMTKINKERDYCIDCSKCPLYRENNMINISCYRFEMTYPDEAVAIVEKWAAEHPRKTRQSEFLKMFPNVSMCNGVIDLNPCNLDHRVCVSRRMQCRLWRLSSGLLARGGRVMKDDLISRSDLLEALKAFGRNDESNDFLRGIEIARKIIKEQPAVDEDDLK